MNDNRMSAPADLGDNPLSLRLMGGMIADAVMLVRERRATAADVDLAMQLGAGYPEGPLAVLARQTAEFRARFPAISQIDIEDTVRQESGFSGPVGVVGTGTMAAGIVEALVVAGRSAHVLYRHPDSFNRLSKAVAARFARAIERNKMTAEARDAALARISGSDDPESLADCGVVIEAVKEDLAVKHALIARLHSILPDALPFATNTSSFRVADLADAAPGRTLFAMHFFNPAGAMKLVELVFPSDTDTAFRNGARGFCHSIGKVPVECADTRGFLVNRLLIPFLNDAVRAHEGGLEVSAIDTAMTEEMDHPMGPFALLDLIGIDVTVFALDSMAETEGDDRLRPAALLRQMAGQGRLGRKSGQGFYSYEARP